MVAALVVQDSAGHNAVGSNILRIVQTNVVRTLGTGNIGEGRRGIGTRHTGEFLRYGVSVRSHQAQPLEGLCINLGVERPTIALARIVEHEGVGQCLALGVCVLEVLIEGTVVGAVHTGKATHVLDTPVGDTDGIDGFVEDELSRSSQRERDRNLIVHCNRGLPNLRHLEVRVHGIDSRTGLTVLRRNSRGTDGSRIVNHHTLTIVNHAGHHIAVGIMCEHIVVEFGVVHDVTSKLRHVDLHALALACSIPDTFIQNHV